jgi:RNA polymerase sigma-70 factor (ECF subfamily)
MSRFEGLKYNEIAKKLSVSVKTIESDMGRALKEFRKELKDNKRDE